MTLYPLGTDTTVWWHSVLEVWRWRFDDNFVLGVQGKRFCDTLSLENGQNSFVALFLKFLANDFVVFRPYIDRFCSTPIAKCFEWLFYSQLFQHPITCSILSVNICCLDLSPAVYLPLFQKTEPTGTIFYASESKKPAQSPPGPLFFFRLQLYQMSFLRQWSLRENGCSGRNRKAVAPWSPFCKLTAGNWS